MSEQFDLKQSKKVKCTLLPTVPKQDRFSDEDVGEGFAFYINTKFPLWNSLVCQEKLEASKSNNE